MLRHISFVPVWDGWVFSRCYVETARTAIPTCDEHSAMIQVYLFALTQTIAKENVILIHLLSIALTLIGLISFRIVLDHLFGQGLSSSQKDILVFFFGLNPIVLAHIIQPNFDLNVALYTIILILFLFKKHYFWASLVGIVMMFTKESGAIVYGTSVYLYMATSIFNSPHRYNSIKRSITTIVVVTIPLILYSTYMIHSPPFQKYKGLTWAKIAQIVAGEDIASGFVVAQVSSLYLINFAWILSFSILLGILLQIILRKKTSGNTSGFLRHREEIYCYTLVIFLTFLLTRISFFNNTRYMLPLLPLFIILFAGSIIVCIKNQHTRVLILLIVLGLVYGSYYKTFDPVAKKIFGTFRFGNHEMLTMSKYTYPVYGYGRDELIYNSEFINFPLLTEKVIEKYGLDKTYVVEEYFTWKSLYFKDYTLFDPITQKRTFNSERGRKIVLLSPSEAVLTKPEEIYFIAYPNVPNEYALRKLLQYFSLEDTTTIENNGYAVDVLKFTIKTLNVVTKY